MNDDFPIPSDGIIGADFLKTYQAKIDLENFYIQFKIQESHVSISILENTYSKFETISARCEATYWLPTSHTTERIFYPQEICEGVYMAGIMVKPTDGKIPIKILNTRETDVKINWVEPKSTAVEDYYVLNYKPSTKKRAKRIDNLLNQINIEKLNKEEIQEIKSICSKYEDIFHLDGDTLTYTNISTAQINLKPDAKPIYCKPYRLPHSQKKNIQEDVDKMLKDDIIEPSVSAWNSPILVVPKKKDPVTGLQKFRMVIDYRRLNTQVADDKFPLPNITDIFDMVGGATYFSCIDLSQGYYQMELDQEGRPYTAFSTETGHYQMKRLPMGLKISPSIFSRMMSIAMSGLVSTRCFVYLDDLIIFGRDLQQHNRNLIEVFERMRQVNLKIHPGKCSFLRKEVLYLGHILSDKGILPDPSKSDVMKNYPIPSNADEVRRFVAFANYYRKFIPNFSSITVPLNRLLKKDVKFEFNKDCETAFTTIKEILTSPKILQFPNFEKDFILRTDASGFAIGAVLSNNDDRPIAYASKTLNKAEKNYSTIEKELLAIVWAVKHYRPYLFGRHFKILTDHRPLVYLFSLKEPSSRLTKFRLLLEEYNFTVEYTPGKGNATADALSRIQIKSDDLATLFIGAMTRSKTKIDQEIKTSDTRDDHPRVTIQELLKPSTGINQLELKIVKNFEEEIVKMEGQDVVIGPNKVLAYIPKWNCILWKVTKDNTETRSTSCCDMLLRDVQKICGPMNIKKLFMRKTELQKLMVGQPDKNINSVKKFINAQFKESDVTIEILKDIKCIDDPKTKKQIINDYHILPTSGHAGVNRMIKNIKKDYNWTGMQNDILNYVRNCPLCQRNKHINTKRQPMQITTTAESSFEKIFVDLVGPLEETEGGNKYILTIQDELTKFIEAVPVTNKEADTVAKGLVEKFILHHGMPSKIASDQGNEFINVVMEKVCKTLKIEQIKSTAYHHESIGALENTHKLLAAYLRSYLLPNHFDWDKWLPYYVFSYNTSVHCSTGYTPFELVYGKQCKLPSNITNEIDPVYNYEDYATEMKNKLQIAHKDAKDALLKNKQKRKINYDASYNTEEKVYEKGGFIMLKKENRKKLDPIYEGPYEIINDVGVNIEIKKNNKCKLVHKNRVKPYYCYIIEII